MILKDEFKHVDGALIKDLEFTTHDGKRCLLITWADEDKNNTYIEIGTVDGLSASVAKNLVYAGPDGSTGKPENAAPIFRSLVASDIPTLNLNTTGQARNGIYYATCDTGQDNGAKIAVLTNSAGFILQEGIAIVVKFTNASSASPMTLQINNESAKQEVGPKTLYQYGTTLMGSGALTTGWPAGAMVLFVYNGTGWVRDMWYNSTYTIYHETVNMMTAAATAAKVGTSAYYEFGSGKHFPMYVRYANTFAGQLTLNINGKGAKDLYINGKITSSTNYTMPSGYYMVYYNGTNYYIRTDGKIDGDLVGNAATATKATNADIATKASNLTNETNLSRFGILYQSGASTTSATNPGVNINSARYLGATTNANGAVTPTWTQLDTTVTENSTNLVTSGAVYTAIADNVAGAVLYLGTVESLQAMTGLTTAGYGDFARVTKAFTIDGKDAHVGDIVILTSNAADGYKDASNWTIAHVEIDTNTWNAASDTADGYVPKYNADNSTDSSSGNTYHFLGYLGTAATNTALKWYSLPANAFNNTTYSTVSKDNTGLCPQLPKEDTITKFLRLDGTWQVPAYTVNTDTHRPILYNGKSILGDNKTALNFVAGSNITITPELNAAKTEYTGKITIAATDTTYNVVTNAVNGLVKAPNNNDSNVSNTQATSDYYVYGIYTKKGTPTWYKLPDAAFSSNTDTKVTTGVTTAKMYIIGKSEGNKAANSTALYDTNLYVTNGALCASSVSASGAITGSNVWDVSTVETNKSILFAKEIWVAAHKYDTLPTAGTYVIQISGGNVYASGVFSITTNDAYKEEIPLHVCGKTDTWRPWAKWDGSSIYLASSTAVTVSVTIKIKRLI